MILSMRANMPRPFEMHHSGRPGSRSEEVVIAWVVEMFLFVGRFVDRPLEPVINVAKIFKCSLKKFGVIEFDPIFCDLARPKPKRSVLDVVVV